MRDAICLSLSAISLVGIAIGSFPPLKMNRATIAVAGATALAVSGCLTLEEAIAAINGKVLLLLFSMMAIVASLKASGLLEAATRFALSRARSPRSLLGLVVVFSGISSAFFINDTVCILVTPLVVGAALRASREAEPYLIAVGIAANIGSCATIIGNPQNMLIGALSGIPFDRFLIAMAPPVLASLALPYLAIVIAYPREFAVGARLPVFQSRAMKIYKPLAIKSIIVSCGMIVAFVAGAPIELAALGAASLLFVTRRIKPERIFSDIDFTLLAFFAGLFVVTKAISTTGPFNSLMEWASRSLQGNAWSLTSVSAAASNVVSNVPAVMLLADIPASFPDRSSTWLVLALSSTFAGNLTLLGSVANLIVAETGARLGARLRFVAFLKVGIPVTLASLAIGTAWLTLLR
jgi:Na+/H+ antiporter NhaD/arsenite permease-like protein